MCAQGLQRDVCQYFLEWIEYIPILSVDNLHRLWRSADRIFHTVLGPGDKTFEHGVRTRIEIGRSIEKSMNAKPYHPLRLAAAIVHFHGPKPTDYLAMVCLKTCFWQNVRKASARRRLSIFSRMDEHIPIPERGQFHCLWRQTEIFHTVLMGRVTKDF